MPKRLLVAIAAIMLVGWFGYSEYEEHLEDKARREEWQQQTNQLRGRLNQLTKMHGANTDWLEILKEGERSAARPVTSIELERAWASGAPILFSGYIDDIRTIDENHYSVEIDGDIFMYATIFTEIKFILKAPKFKLDEFLEKHPKAMPSEYIDNGVAVFAKIDRLGPSRKMTYENEDIPVRIAIGTLLDIVYIGLHSDAL